MLIAHLTDAHVTMRDNRAAGLRQPDAQARLRRAVEAVRTQPVAPDLVLFSGDLGDDGTDAEYAHIGQELRSLGIPVLAVPGNHDRRAPMHQALPDMTRLNDDGHVCFVDADWPVAIVGLDTLVEGKPHGDLCPRRLHWLSGALDRLRDRHVVIFMHHPPILTGLAHLDSMGLLAGAAEFAALVAKHGGVEAILCGHMHRAIQGRCGGAPVFVAPSVYQQFAFDLRKDVRYATTDEPAQFMMHLKLPEQSLISHTVTIDDA